MAADVTGQIGGQPVELKNAATEATLKQLVSAMAVMSARMGKTKQSQAEIEKELRKFQQQLKKTTDTAKRSAADDLKQTRASKDAAAAQQKDNAETKKAAATKKDYTSTTHKVGSTLRVVGSKALGLAESFANLGREIAEMGDNSTNVAALFRHVPIVGGLMAGMFGAAAASAEKLYDTFKTTASVGANFNGSITEMISGATAVGLTFDQFAQVIQKNGESIALLGQGSADGAKRLMELGKTMKSSGLNTELYRMGYSTEEINSALATHGARLARTGALQGMTTKQLAESTSRYLKDLDAVAKLTGKSKDSLQAQEDARMRDAQYMAFRSKLDATGQKNLEALMKSIPEGMQEGAKEVLATGFATSAAGERYLAFMQTSGQSLAQLGIEARRTGTITQQQAHERSKLIQEEGAALADSPLGDTLALFVPEMNGLMLSAIELRARQIDLATATQQAAQAVANAPTGLDAATMAELKAQIAGISNMMTEFFATSGLIELMMSLLPTLIRLITDVVMPALRDIAVLMKTHSQDIVDALILVSQIGIGALKLLFSHFELITGAILGAIVAVKAFKAIMAIKQFKEASRGATPANAMWTREVGLGQRQPGAGGGGGGKTDKKDDSEKPKRARDSKGRFVKATPEVEPKGGRFGKIGNVVKGAGAVGAILSLGMLASDLKDIREREEAGELTPEEAKKAKIEEGGAVAGALSGAAAGAAVGSMVPVVGTIVGGLIGGAIGGWLGRYGGKAVGEAVNKSPSKPSGPADGEAAAPVTPAPTAAKPTPSAPATAQADNSAASTDAVLKTAQSAVLTAETARKALETESANKTKEFQRREDDLKKQIAQLKEAEAKKTAEPQEKILTELKSLNTNITTMINKQTEAVGLLNNQLTVQKNMTGSLTMDLFQAA
jgi:hypothetical protein